MAIHLPLEKLLAYHDDQLGSAERTALQLHLKECAFCAGNLTLIAQSQPTSQIQPTATGEPAENQTSCSDPETIGKYITHELSYSKHREVEKHLAGCAACRRRLVEIFQISIEPVSEEEKEILAALPPFEITEQVRKIMTVRPQPPTPASFFDRLLRWLHPPTPELRFARNAALATAALAVFYFGGYQPFRSWQANHYADSAMARLQKVWTITDDELRPDVDLQQSLFSQTHSAEETPVADTVEIEFRKAFEWRKNNRAARLGLATYRCFTNDFAAADSLIALLLAENPRDFAAWNARGLIAAGREDSTAALAAFAQALQIRPDYAVAAYNRADLLLRLNRRKEAAQAWQNYLALDSQSKWADVARRRLRGLRR